MSAALRVNDLVARINEIIGEDINLAISRAELQNPTPKIVEALIYQFLMEFQHSDFMNQGHPIIEMKMGDLLTNDIKETLHLDILVVAARKFFERIEFRDYSFGIMDIVNPQPKRIQKFLSQMVNFWLFCNSEFETIEQRKLEVMEKAKGGKALQKDLNQNRREIEDLQEKIQTIEINNEKVHQDIKCVESDLADLMSKNAEVQTQAKAYKDEIAELTKLEDVLKDNIEKCENEKKRLELLVKSDETKHELETQITKLKEESDAKVQKVHECKVKQQEYKQRLAQFQKYLKELQHLTVKHETIQKTRQEIEQLEAEKEEKGQALSIVDDELGLIQQQLDDLKKELASQANSWNRKKSCLEAEIKDYQKEIEKIRQGMSEEEIAASDLESKIAEVNRQNDEIKRLKEKEAAMTRDAFNELRSSYLIFDRRMDEELRKLALAWETIENGKNHASK